MKLGRRDFMCGLLACSMPVISSADLSVTSVSGMDDSDLLIVDSRFPALTHYFQSGRRNEAGAAPWLDIANMKHSDWYELATLKKLNFKVVRGYSSWQDFVVFRDIFRAEGLRMSAPEERLDAGVGRSLFAWEMRSRRRVQGWQ